MIKRIAAIIFIYACTVVGFLILSGTVFIRTETQDKRLKSEVGQLWGSKHIQTAPLFCLPRKSENTTPEMIPIESSNIQVKINLEHRKKGLLWYATYAVDFSGQYKIKNPFNENRPFDLYYKFPSDGAVYDNFKISIAGKLLENLSSKSGQLQQTINLDSNQEQNFDISYKSQGLGEWQYSFGYNVNQVKNFRLVIFTDFEDIDFLEKSISPTSKERSGKGWKLTWEYSNMLTGFNIGILLPQKLNPGPWVSRVTLAAPVSLFLFFFVLFVFTTVRKIKIHPMNYFFIGAAFFSFYLLMAYLVDHISVYHAFVICSAVSVFLVASYIRLVIGTRFALLETAIWQLIYLVLFSYTFFFEGYTGLAITILCICTLFVTMQFTGRIDWDKMFSKEKDSV